MQKSANLKYMLPAIPGYKRRNWNPKERQPIDQIQYDNWPANSHQIPINTEQVKEWILKYNYKLKSATLTSGCTILCELEPPNMVKPAPVEKEESKIDDLDYNPYLESESTPNSAEALGNQLRKSLLKPDDYDLSSLGIDNIGQKDNFSLCFDKLQPVESSEMPKLDINATAFKTENQETTVKDQNNADEITKELNLIDDLLADIENS